MVRGDGEEPSIHRKLPGWPLYGEPHWRYPRLLPIARHAKGVSLMASPNSPSKRATERVVASGGALPAPTECPYCKSAVRVVSNSVVYGREYGANARPMEREWVRSLRDQCALNSTAFHFKQWGEFAPNWMNDDAGKEIEGSAWTDRMGKRIAGRMLDGVVHDAYPGEVK